MNIISFVYVEINSILKHHISHVTTASHRISEIQCLMVDFQFMLTQTLEIAKHFYRSYKVRARDQTANPVSELFLAVSTGLA
jgi:hypothetical protein